jgi:carbonic anhydrase
MSKRLFEAMIDANHRALAGDSHAGLHPAEYEEELPLVALTCVDARLNALLPQALGVPPEQFIWLRNAGNIITGPLSSTMRSLALACAVKGGKEIVIIGHTDCQVGKTNALQLLDRFRALGIERHMLPDNLNEYFGIFGSDRQNVMKAAEIARSSPLIGPKVPVHGLLIEIDTGRLEWLVNGYQTLGAAPSALNQLGQTAESAFDALKPLAGFNLGEMKFPETKIGEVATTVGNEILQRMQAVSVAPVGAGGQQPGSPSNISAPVGFNLGELKVPPVKIGEIIQTVGDELSQKLHRATVIQGALAKPSQPGAAPPKIPLPPPLRPKMHLRRNPK